MKKHFPLSSENHSRLVLKRWFAALMIVLVLASCAVNAFADTYTSKPAVITANTRVYRSASTSSASIKVKKGTNVDLLAVKGKWALVENDGVRAYIKASQVSVKPSQPDYSALLQNAKPAIITANTRVYRSASTSSPSCKVKKGTKVRLLDVNGKWALVENGGAYAFVKASQVSVETPQPDFDALLQNAKPAIITHNTKVFKSASTSSASIKVKKGLNVNLLDVSGKWAIVENRGVFAYMDAGLVSPLSSKPEPTPVPTPTPEPEQPDYSDLLPDAKDAVLTADARVYQFADVSSSSVSAAKGTKIRLLAIKSDWALIEKSGVYGFVSASKVALAPVVTPTPSPSPTPTPAPVEDYFTSSKYSNEQKCYFFLTREAGLNRAAASGILANLRHESNFNPSAGSSYYGLVQWGGGRLSNMKSYCASNGYSSSSLEGQLRFLLHELKNSYPSVLKTLKAVPNTAEGAYDAGYRFCYDFERPANKASKSVSRGELARDTYFPKYK